MESESNIDRAHSDNTSDSSPVNTNETYTIIASVVVNCTSTADTVGIGTTPDAMWLLQHRAVLLCL